MLFNGDIRQIIIFKNKNNNNDNGDDDKINF